MTGKTASPDEAPARRSRAFVDESYRAGEHGQGLYVFSAVTVAASRDDDLRERLRRALPRRMERFHWGKDSDRVRARCLEVIRASITRTSAVAGLRYTFARPLDEPLLWLPDYLAGIHRTARLDGVGRWLDQLPAAMVEVIEAPPRNL